MSKIILLFAASAALLPGVHFPSSWRYAHPDARVFAGLDIHQLMKSAAGQQIREQLAKAGFSEVHGIEIVNDIDRIFVSARAKDLSDPRPADALAVISGRFRLDWLRKLAVSEGASVAVYKNVEIIAPPKALKSDVHFALIDSQTILVSDREGVIAAIERGGVTAAEQPAADSPLGRSREMADRHDLWIVSAGPLDEIAGAKASKMPFAADIDWVQAGLTFREGLRLDLLLNTRSGESAKAIAAGIQMLAPYAAQQQPALAELASKLQIGVESTVVQVALAIDANDVERSLGRFAASMGAPGGKPFDLGGTRAVLRANVPVEMTKPDMRPVVDVPQSPRKMVIRIEGLDEGPREIAYPNR